MNEPEEGPSNVLAAVLPEILGKAKGRDEPCADVDHRGEREEAAHPEVHLDVVDDLAPTPFWALIH